MHLAFWRYLYPPSRDRAARLHVLLFGSLLLGVTLVSGLRLIAQATTTPPAQDGSHDFEFNFGVWHTSITRVSDPFQSGAPTMKLEGTVTVRRVWGGRTALEEIEAEGANGHWEGLSLFLYNPQAHQWRGKHL